MRGSTSAEEEREEGPRLNAQVRGPAKYRSCLRKAQRAHTSPMPSFPRCSTLLRPGVAMMGAVSAPPGHLIPPNRR
jgi:hypothetical protein